MGIRQMPTLVYEWGGGIIGLFTYVQGGPYYFVLFYPVRMTIIEYLRKK